MNYYCLLPFGDYNNSIITNHIRIVDSTIHIMADEIKFLILENLSWFLNIRHVIRPTTCRNRIILRLVQKKNHDTKERASHFVFHKLFIPKTCFSVYIFYTVHYLIFTLFFF